MNKIVKLMSICLILILAFGISACSNSDDEATNDDPLQNAPVEESTQGDNSGGDNATVSIVGDSVPLGAIVQLQEALPDAELLIRTDRDLAGPGLELLKEESEAGQLGDIVILALGTSNLEGSDIDNAIEVIGPDRQIVFVTAYKRGADYIDKVNKAINDAANAHPDNFTVADWFGFVEANPDIELAEDNCHLTDESAVDYVSIIMAGVEEARSKLNA